MASPVFCPKRARSSRSWQLRATRDAQTKHRPGRTSLLVHSGCDRTRTDEPEWGPGHAADRTSRWRDLGALPACASGRRGRVWCGLRGRRRGPVTAGGREGAEGPGARRRLRGAGAGSVLARGTRRVARSPRARGRGARLRRPRGGAIPRHGVRRWREPGAVARARGGAPARSGGRHPLTGTVRSRRAAREPRRAPRHQAGEHLAPARRGDTREARGFRRFTSARRPGRAHAFRRHRRNRRIYGARARAGRTCRSGEQRPVRPRGRPLRVRDGTQAVPWVDGLRGDPRVGQQRPSAAVPARPRPSP